jgi:septal ring factor EnvC (AmiA/AmiB activator)
MNQTSFSLKVSVLTSLLISGQILAQNLPDEINHTQYLKIYQDLEQVLNQKMSEFNQLSELRQSILKSIAQMEKDQNEIPARNSELRRIIDNKRSEIAKLDSEIQGLEGILAKIIEDLRRMENIISQLQRDINSESNRNMQIQTSLNQASQELSQINSRLQREIREENESVQAINRLVGETNASIQRRDEIGRERGQAIRNAESFKTEIIQVKNNISQNQTNLTNKKTQLNLSQTKLNQIKGELSTEESKLAQIDTTLAPKKEKLNKLKADLARVSPDIARLLNENKSLEQKISMNETRINSLNVNPMITRRDFLENEISSVKNQIKVNTETQTALEEKIEPVMDEIRNLNLKMQQALRDRNLPEAARLKNQIDELLKSTESDRNQINRLQKESEHLAKSIGARQGEINSLNASIANAEAQIINLRNEIESSKVKISENEKKIVELSSANTELSQQIAVLDAEIKDIESQRYPTAQKVAALKQQEIQISGEISAINLEMKKLETEIQKLTLRVSEMEKFILDLPENLRRMDAHVRQLGQKISELRNQIDREERLLVRIRQNRMSLEVEAARSQSILNQINRDLNDSERLLSNLRLRLNEEGSNRDALMRYNQDSMNKLGNLKTIKSRQENEVTDASNEIRINEQDLATIQSSLPKLRADLENINPKLSAAERARNLAQTNADAANSKYLSRLTLFQKYLSEAQSLGSESALIGTQDGLKSGKIDASVRAKKLGSENASTHAKWDALRRGYVRGEISGFKSGYDIGLSSSRDSSRGEEEGRIAGARRAKDYANMVVKPEKYHSEFERRLREDETNLKKVLLSKMIKQDLTLISSVSRDFSNDIPELSAEEVKEASLIVTSLDALISQSEIEIREVIDQRNKLNEPKNVYQTPAPGENANNVNCSGVYKGVKEFINACKESYQSRYDSLYKLSHEDSFTKNYASNFQEQVRNVYQNELSRLYPVYLREASKIAEEAGISSGKKDIYQQSFNRAELSAYALALPGETSRVEVEANQLVQDHLNQNAALTLKAKPKLIANGSFGISPGVNANLNLSLKNIGLKTSSGESLIKITEMSPSVSLDRKEAPLPSVAPRSNVEADLLRVKVSDDALPGSQIVLAGEVIHPGNHYAASRVETFRIETVLKINPEVESYFELDSTPKVSGLFGTKKHDINLKIKPKFSGVDQGYEFSLEEVGTQVVSIVSLPNKSEVLGRNVEKKVRFTYKLDKTARGKTIILKLIIRNNGQVVSQSNLEIRPE